jgi:putative SOS response-associated peptidase YedK
VRAVLVREEEGAPHRQLRTVRWGLVPAWAKDPSVGSRMINARVETVTEKPAYRRAASHRRCLLPADGYYEWERREVDGRVVKVPHFLSAEGGEPLAFAGLYELWPDPSKAEDDPGRWLWTTTVITTRASDALGRIHERTPLVVPADMQADWVDASLTDLELVRQVLDAVPEPHLQAHEVSKAVGSPRNDGPQLVLPVDAG